MVKVGEFNPLSQHQSASGISSLPSSRLSLMSLEAVRCSGWVYRRPPQAL